MHKLTLSQLSHQLDRKVFSSVELVQHYIERIERLNPQLNPYISTHFDRALDQAKHADAQRLSQSKPHPLLGIPVAIKDNFCTDFLPTTCASKMLADFRPPYNATVVSRLEQVGCITLGKTNMDEFAMGSSNETSFYGPCLNPWDLDRVPGGSSGGSATAVAAYLAPFALGTDTGGSIRQPSAFCNVTGLKPTYGRISRYGMIAFASSLDQCGPMAQTAQDIALIMETLAGHDPQDETCSRQPIPHYRQAITESIAGKTIGLPQQWFDTSLSSDNAKSLEDAIQILTALGAKFKPVDLPNLALCLAMYYIIAPSECASNLARYDGIHYGYRTIDPTSLGDLYRRSRSEAFGDEVKRRILLGTFALSSSHFDAYYAKAQKLRELIRQDYRRAFESCDAIMGPTTTSAAFRLGEKNKDPVSMYQSDIYTISANLANLPALSIPMGLSDGCPIGLQLVGRPFDESTLLNIAHQFQCQTDHHLRCPPGFEQPDDEAPK